MRHSGRGFLRVLAACVVLCSLIATPAEAGWFEKLFGLRAEQPPAAPTVRLPKRAPVPTPRPSRARFMRSAIIPMPIGQPAGMDLIPTGYWSYCHRYPQDCGSRDMINLVPIDDLVVDALVAVNRGVNDTIRGMSDLRQYGQEEWWGYPTSGYGDCEDYVLEKRRRLIALGFPDSALLITYVKVRLSTGEEEGHVVLTVAGDYGDLVLDSLIPEVLPWQAVPYRFISRQSPWDGQEWERIDEPAVGSLAMAN